MNFKDMLEKLISRKQEAKKTVRQRAIDLADKIAAGTSATVEEIERTLDAAGLDAGWLAERIEWPSWQKLQTNWGSHSS